MKGSLHRRIVEARVDGSVLLLELSDGQQIQFPLRYAPRLDLATDVELAAVDVVDDGDSVHFSTIDDYVSLAEAERWALPKIGNLPHKCKTMVDAVGSIGVCVEYEDSMREYSIPVHGYAAAYTLSYCPFCGDRLPGSLRDEWFIELRNAGLEPEDDLPERLRDGTWWRERGA